MNVTVNPVDQHKVTLTIEVPAKDFSKSITSACKRIANQVNIPGFRKGKAPRRILELNFGKDAIMEEAFEIAAGQAYSQALREKSITPVTDPEIERVTFEEGKDLVFKATLVKEPEVTLGEYKGLEVEKEDATVSDEEVAKQLDAIANQHAKMVVAEEGAKLQNDDFAVIDFKGTIDGKPFDGGEGKSYPLQIGSGNFIPGFEEQLVGKAAGEDVVVKVTFPEEYFVKELAGKEAEFTVHIHDIKRRELPELNDDFAKETSSYETIDALKTDLRAKLEENAQRQAVEAYNGKLIKLAVDNAQVDIPEVMVEQRIDQMLQELSMSMEARGMKFDEYLKFSGKDVAALREEYKETAAANVRTDLVLTAIANAEKLEVTNEDLNYEIISMANQFGADPKEVFDIIRKEGRLNMLVGSVVRKKAARLIVDQAKGAKAE